MQAPLLVVTDVDGTLLTSGDGISTRTRSVIDRLQDLGVPLVLATGRPPRWIPMLIDLLGFAPLAICGNGAVLYDSSADRVLHAENLEPETLDWLAELARDALPGCGLAAERVGDSAFDAADQQFVSEPHYEHAWLNPDDTRVSATEVTAAPAIKLLARVPGASSQELHDTVAPLLKGRAVVTYSTNNGLIEFAKPGISKAAGLAKVAALLSVPIERTVAFGDMPNDISMLSVAGLGVAMGNAHSEAIAAANETTGTNDEDGLAAVLERWF